MPLPTGLAMFYVPDVSKSVSAVSFEDLDLDASHGGGNFSWTPPEETFEILATVIVAYLYREMGLVSKAKAERTALRSSSSSSSPST